MGTKLSGRPGAFNLFAKPPQGSLHQKCFSIQAQLHTAADGRPSARQERVTEAPFHQVMGILTPAFLCNLVTDP